MCRAFLFCFVLFCLSPLFHLVFVTLKLSEVIFQILMSARQKPTNVKLRKCATIPGDHTIVRASLATPEKDLTAKVGYYLQIISI